ncbi:MAG: AtpZ/AtpI family protein [Lachnospiraceae bacterium]|nr:AtpZ/AtpI family protein [Lachnospiraceae bacterium]
MGKNKKYKKSVYQSLAVITQFGINMLVPIFLCSFAGLFLDRKFGTAYWFVLLFFVGALAGFRNIFILAKKIYEGDSSDEDRHQQTKRNE